MTSLSQLVVASQIGFAIYLAVTEKMKRSICEPFTSTRNHFLMVAPVSQVPKVPFTYILCSYCSRVMAPNGERLITSAIRQLNLKIVVVNHLLIDDIL
jgi:hypothetical protein